MASLKPIRIGFIGAGGNTRLRHLPGFAGIEGVQLAVVANRSMQSARSVAEEFSIREVRDDWRSIITDPDIDAVCIGTWPNTHAEMTIAALTAGKSVLVEARMAASLAEAETMAEVAAKHSNLVAQIVPAPFSLDADATIRNVIQSGKIGEVREVASAFTNSATADPAAPLSWRLDERISGINMMGLGICYEPILRWIPGDVTVVSADGAVFTKHRIDATGETCEVKIPESLSVLGKWENGARLVMHQSSVEHEGGRNSYRIVGSKGTLKFNASEQNLTLISPDGGTEQIEFPQTAHGGWRVEEQFVHSIRSGKPVELTDFVTGRRYMEFTNSVWNAWTQG